MALVTIPANAPDDSATVTTLMHSADAGSCQNCGAPMASDQRYCITCGTRRGAARFSAESPRPSGPVPEPAAGGQARQGRWGPAATIIAGIGTLLLAMGVGVIIGHNGTSNGSTKAAAPQVITVGGGAAASQPAVASAGGKQASTTGSKKVKTTVVRVTPKVSKAAVSAATKVLGASAPKNPTVKVGESCKAGDPGCKGGKFTGEFFGP